MLPLGYIFLSLLTTTLLFWIGSQALKMSQAANSRKLKASLLIVLLAWQLYIFLIAALGLLQDFSFPPRFVLFMILPAFLFTGIFAYRNRNARWLREIPSHWLIYFQTFRLLIETLFVFSVAQGVLHKQVTIEGFNYDMVFALTAPLVGYLIQKRIKSADKLALAWNYLGLLVIASIIFLFLTTIYFPQLYGSRNVLLPKEFGLFPYVLVPGFLMPSAVFVHVLSIVQLTKKLQARKLQLSL